MVVEVSPKGIIEKIEEWDFRLFLSFYNSDFSKKKLVKRSAKVFSFFGNYYFWAMIWFSIFIYGFITKDYFLFVLFNGGFDQSFILYVLIRYVIVNRNRPFITLGDKGVEKHDQLILESKSFPSGHVTFFVFFGYIFSFYFQNWYILLGFMIFAVFMAVTRLILGVHFPSDVIFAFVFGSLFALLYLGLTYPYWVAFHYWVGELWIFNWFFELKFW